VRFCQAPVYCGWKCSLSQGCSGAWPARPGRLNTESTEDTEKRREKSCGDLAVLEKTDCVRCGYDAGVATLDRCPECGWRCDG
jgi:hypothetical protein